MNSDAVTLDKNSTETCHWVGLSTDSRHERSRGAVMWVDDLSTWVKHLLITQGLVNLCPKCGETKVKSLNKSRSGLSEEAKHVLQCEKQRQRLNLKKAQRLLYVLFIVYTRSDGAGFGLKKYKGKKQSNDKRAKKQHKRHETRQSLQK